MLTDKVLTADVLTADVLTAEVARTPVAVRSPRPAGHLGGLDGLRALAVAAVVIFHLDPDLLPGGFLGVDVFFVISGFLITHLLVGEVTRTGRIALGAFYLRRVRRLAPALAVLLVVVAAAGTWVWTDQLATLHAGLLASVGNVTNWWLVYARESYFVSSGRPPMLQHLWSLAIEEQYYLLWPALILLTLRLRQRSGRPITRGAAVAAVALVLAVVSTIVMASTAIRDGVPFRADSARVYFGTDTHAAGLLLGSAAGALRRPPKREGSAASLGSPRDLVALAALVVVCSQFVRVDEFQPALYRGGLGLFDLLVVGLVVAVTARGSAIGRALDASVLRWVGVRSYAIYLWHWPVCTVTRPGLDLAGPAWLVNVLRVMLILALADVSYRLVERRFRSRRPAAVAVAVARSEAGVDVENARAEPTVAPPTMRGLVHAGPAWAAAGAVAVVGLLIVNAAAGSGHLLVAAPAASAPPPARAARPLHAGVSVFGDSVLLGAAPALRAWDAAIDVNAVEGAQPATMLDAVVRLDREHRLRRGVVIHIGNNGVIDPGQLRDVLHRLGGHRVVLIDDHVPRNWQTPNNRTITAAATGFTNTKLVGWNRIAGAHPGYLYADGIHLTPSGARAYVDLVVAALR